MIDDRDFDVIIIGGSYSGLSAGMALGRALRQVLIIDSGKPCNAQTPHSHNFLTQDGQTPQEISSKARKQVANYPTIRFHEGYALSARKIDKGFEIATRSGDRFTAKKLIFATGIKDIMPNIEGFAQCWGISIIHCPYCHGYEVKHQKTAVFGNGEYGFEFSKMIHNWTEDLSLFTNGKSTLTGEQTEKLREHNINIIETEVDRFEHHQGQIKVVHFKDGSKTMLKALYARTDFEQHSDIPKALGCELTEEGYIEVDLFQKTTIDGVFACGDNTTFMRSVSNAVAAGTVAGAVVNKELIDEAF
ncbi:NAD(P)/FAD-dependent oxidoreductase [Flavobacteriaceae bacterium 3-367]